MFDPTKPVREQIAQVVGYDFYDPPRDWSEYPGHTKDLFLREADLILTIQAGSWTLEELVNISLAGKLVARQGGGWMDERDG